MAAKTLQTANGDEQQFFLARIVLLQLAIPRYMYLLSKYLVLTHGRILFLDSLLFKYYSESFNPCSPLTIKFASKSSMYKNITI